MLTAKAFQDTRHKLLTAKEQCAMKISYLQKINRACLYSYLIRYQIIRYVAFTKPFVPVSKYLPQQKGTINEYKKLLYKKQYTYLKVLQLRYCGRDSIIQVRNRPYFHYMYI